MLHVANLIIERIVDQVPEFKTVSGPSVLASIASSGIGGLLPACIVIPGAAESLVKVNRSGAGLEQQEWNVVIIVGYQNKSATNGQAEEIAGQLMSAVRLALHGLRPSQQDEQRHIKYIGRDAPVYSIGYAEFPLTFSIDALI